MNTAKIIKVYGKVQQVGFRFYTRKKAQELGLYGFVKNELDGSVYIEVEGPEIEMEHFVLWCHQGPKWARVDKVLANDCPALNLENFVVK